MSVIKKASECSMGLFMYSTSFWCTSDKLEIGNTKTINNETNTEIKLSNTMKDPLPIPAQLEKQLSKCKTVRDADTFFKSREKTKQVRVVVLSLSTVLLFWGNNIVARWRGRLYGAAGCGGHDRTAASSIHHTRDKLRINYGYGAYCLSHFGLSSYSFLHRWYCENVSSHSLVC